jgi:hypothetical protein
LDVLQPGDTLTLLDGVYNQSFDNAGTKGLPGSPITVRAQNDGQAIIDGQGVRVPIKFWFNAVDYYFVFEGIVARNSSEHVIANHGSHNIYRRVSAYNAHIDRNAHAIFITGSHNLVEDCMLGGSGRKMLVMNGNSAQYNTVRRCFADWREWDGREWCSSQWPWGEGMEFYNASNNIIENSIAYGNTPRAGISLLAQGGAESSGNKVLGSISIASGMKQDGTPMVWGETRPEPTTCWSTADLYNWPGYFSGFDAHLAGATMRDNLFQDILAWGNGAYGLSATITGDNASSNNRVNRATIFSNGLNPNRSPVYGGVGAGTREEDLAFFGSVENSNIENIYTGSGFTSMTGEGARLSTRYVNGVLTDEPLWPWPMEERIKAEWGISVTDLVTGIITQTP